jgi:hypothetical protein
MGFWGKYRLLLSKMFTATGTAFAGTAVNTVSTAKDNAKYRVNFLKIYLPLNLYEFD